MVDRTGLFISSFFVSRISTIPAFLGTSEEGHWNPPSGETGIALTDVQRNPFYDIMRQARVLIQTPRDNPNSKLQKPRGTANKGATFMI